MDIRQLNSIDTNLWEIPKTGKMRVPGRVYASPTLLNLLKADESLKQVANVAHLPGILGYSIAMPDIHWGYGFPIGGVAAMDFESGVISPGGVGYDINCGVRLIRTNLQAREIEKQIKNIIAVLFNRIPTGVGSHGAIKKLSHNDMKKVLRDGSGWAIANGFGEALDLQHTEEKGCIDGADPELISARAYERGAPQLGTLGSGNHFIELSRVSEIYDQRVAQIFGIEKDQVVVQIHTGSRGLGYQVCDDFIKVTLKAVTKYGIEVPDRQLACAPLSSQEGKDYLAAMRAAANFAFANRQVIYALVENALLDTMSISPDILGFKLVWDIAHNIAKIETHMFEGKPREVCVHRKGATRAFGPGSSDLPDDYRIIGQPVLIPGDMGTESYLCVGTKKAMQTTFGSSCHGAGRVMSRRQAQQHGRSINLYKEMEKRGVFVMAEGKGTIAEEMPYAYKNVTEVVNTMHEAGITRKIARFVPLGVIKG